MDKKRYGNFLALLFSGIIFGSFGIWVKLLSKDFTNFQQIAFRNFLALLIAVFIIVYKRVKIDFSKVDKKRVIQFGIAFPLVVIFLTFSLVSTKVVLSIFSFYVSSLLSSFVIGYKIFNEKVTVNKIISLVLVGLGLASFLALGTIDGIDRGIIYALIAGLFDAVANGYRKYLSGKVDRILLTTVPLVGGAIIALIVILLTGETFTFQASVTSWIVGITFGLLLFVVNYLMFYGFSNFDLNLGTIVISSELIFASVFAFIVFSELPLPNEILGAVFIASAIIIANTKEIRINKFFN